MIASMWFALGFAVGVIALGLLILWQMKGQ